jgi:predicted dehydrogenase
MAALTDLHRTVQATLASKRLGQAVFVRCTLQDLGKPETIVPKLAHLAALAREWLGQPLARVYAVGSPAAGNVSLTLQFRAGATALISYAHGPPQGDGIDLMVIGQRGAIYHDVGAGDLWDEPAAGAPEPVDPALRAIIERALRSGQPEAFGQEGKP